MCKIDAELFVASEERALHDTLVATSDAVERLLASGDFAGAMMALTALRPPLNAFFDAVTVNVDDRAVRANRLALLECAVNMMDRVADFSKIRG